MKKWALFWNFGVHSLRWSQETEQKYVFPYFISCTVYYQFNWLFVSCAINPMAFLLFKNFDLSLSLAFYFWHRVMLFVLYKITGKVYLAAYLLYDTGCVLSINFSSILITIVQLFLLPKLDVPFMFLYRHSYWCCFSMIGLYCMYCHGRYASNIYYMHMPNIECPTKK